MRGTVNIPEVAVILRRNGKILFIERQHTGFADGTLCMPGGHVERAESFSSAACREVLEEVGLTVRLSDLRPVFTMQRMTNPDDIRIAVIFEATHWTGEARNMEPERHGDPEWIADDELPFDKIMPFQANILRGLQDGKQYVETGWQE